jgi:NAD+ synthase (glutamine-hydrolysing)
MPGFGTTARTKNNSINIAEEYGCSLREISISDAVSQHFSDIGHDPEVRDITYENSQARERTQILMDVANQEGGIVIGTGDLSELALGWATYNGDHMSMYGVNCSIPKTLVRYLVSYESTRTADENPTLSKALADIVATPVSPELLPPTEDGKISQKTEETVGPYELHDFFLYYMIRYGFAPSKIYRLALIAFDGEYDADTIYKWEETFIKRFFAQQFKRSCLPDGPKVGTVTLSPRGDWRMPSDASRAIWLADLETVKG